MWLDRKRSFGEHVARVAPRARVMANSLARLLPNIGGASGYVRRLYVATIHSLLLYAVPNWTEKRLRKHDLSTRPIERATTLAGIPPNHLIAKSHARVYTRTKAIRDRGDIITARAKRTLKLQAKATLLRKWKDFLANPRLGGRRVREAIRLVLEEWVERKGRGLTLHTAQVNTGHGCFSDYLRRIGKEHTTRCLHCPEEADTAQHTLEHCPAWEERRRVLRASVGEDLSLSAIVAAVTEGVVDQIKWKAFASFCKEVMSQKEAVERIKRREAPPSSEGSDGRVNLGSITSVREIYDGWRAQDTISGVSRAARDNTRYVRGGAGTFGGLAGRIVLQWVSVRAEPVFPGGADRSAGKWSKAWSAKHGQDRGNSAR
ncbi:uncharacterized protein [Temnothorax longispinosus]|uniref:uncharacterized protein n=1 Tax=Temnothorax longispinosus TaxID=300112 RepID=UPI003A998775